MAMMSAPCQAFGGSTSHCWAGAAVPAGLGPAADTCAIISELNVGDGHTVCGAEEMKKCTTNTGYTVSSCCGGLQHKPNIIAAA
jgi:hypothetical protein